MAFETRARGISRRKDLMEASGDAGVLSRIAPVQRAATPPGAGRAQRIRDIVQKNQLFGLTSQAESRANQIEMDRARFAEQQRRAGEAETFRTGQAEEAKRRFEIGRQDRLDELQQGRQERAGALDESRRRFNIGREDDARRFDLTRRDKLMMKFTPESVEEELRKTGGLSRPGAGVELNAPVRGVTDVPSTPSEGSMVPVSQRRFTGSTPQTTPPRTTPQRTTAVEAQREIAPRRTPGDLTALEGQQVRVGNKNNVPGVWFQNPDTGKQEFVGEGELKQYFGDDFELGAPSATTTDEGVIRFRPSMTTLPTTERGSKLREEAESGQAIKDVSAPAPGLTRPAQGKRQDGLSPRTGGGLQLRPAAPGTRGARTTDFTKNMEALSTDLERLGVPSSQMFDELGEPTRRMKAFAQSMNQSIAAGMPVDQAMQRAVRGSGLQTTAQIELQDYERAKEIVQSGRGRGFFGDTDEFKAAQETVREFERRNPQAAVQPPDSRPQVQQQMDDAAAVLAGRPVDGKPVDREDKRVAAEEIRKMLANPEENQYEILKSFIGQTDMFDNINIGGSRVYVEGNRVRQRKADAKTTAAMDELANKWASKVIRQAADSNVFSAIIGERPGKPRSEIGFDKAFEFFKRQNPDSDMEDFKITILQAVDPTFVDKAIDASVRYWTKVSSDDQLDTQFAETLKR